MRFQVSERDLVGLIRDPGLSDTRSVGFTPAFLFRHLVDLQQVVRLSLVSWALVRFWFPCEMQVDAPLTVTLRGIRMERDTHSVAD